MKKNVRSNVSKKHSKTASDRQHGNRTVFVSGSAEESRRRTRTRRTPVFAVAGVLVMAALVLGACAGQRSGEAASPPDWVSDPPEDTSQTVYFTASAGEESGTDATVPELREEATYTLIDQIVRYLGVRVTADTTATAKASLERFETEVTQQVTQRSEARVTGFRIEDSYVSRGERRTTVYLLASYERSALEQEKRRLEELFVERVAAVEEPLAEARRLEASGDYVAALRSYVEAAAAASASTIDNADVKLRESLENARRILSGIRFTEASGPAELSLRQPVEEPFRARVVYGNGRPVGGAPVELAYRVMRANGRAAVETRTVTAAEDGWVTFTPPAPTVIGSQPLSMRLDIGDAVETIEQIDGAENLLDGLRTALADTRARIEYEVVSRARAVPTAVLVLETDAAGNPTGRRDATAGIIESMSQAGFQVRALSLDPAVIRSRSRDGFLELAAEETPESVERVVFGTVSIAEFSEADSVLVKVSGGVRTVDLATGNVLYVAEGLQYSRASGAQTAISAAFHSLGSKLGQELVNNLP
jgi:hypothetical protein